MPSKEDKLKSLVQSITSDDEEGSDITEEDIIAKLSNDFKTSKELFSTSSDEDAELNGLQNMLMGMQKPQQSNNPNKDLQYLRDLEAKANRGKDAITRWWQ